MSAKQRSQGERHPICQERPAQSLAAGWAPVLSCLPLPPFPSSPPPPQAVQDSPFSLLPSPGCPPLSRHPPAWGVARPGLSFQMRRGPRIQNGFLSPQGARLPRTPASAPRHLHRLRMVSAFRRPPWSPGHFANPRGCPPFFFPASPSRPYTFGAERTELAFFFSDRTPSSFDPGFR